MKIAVTGGTGFIGRYILRLLSQQGHQLRAWKRDISRIDGLETLSIEWIDGNLGNTESMQSLCQGCDAIVHAALWKPGQAFRGGEGPVAQFVQTNVVGTLNLISSAIEQEVDRFVFLSTGAVHEVVLEDRPLDESHPCWSTSHYGAHKAAIEKFVHSYGLGQNYNICALRPTGVYGLNSPAESSKWFGLVKQIQSGKDVQVVKGGKEVHAADVAKATEILLKADQTSGQAFNCCDSYISHFTVAQIAKQLSGSSSVIEGQPRSSKHTIQTQKLEALGMKFGREPLLEKTIQQILDAT